MAVTLTPYGKNLALSALLPSGSSVWVGLLTALPTSRVGTDGTEASGAGYSRVEFRDWSTSNLSAQTIRSNIRAIEFDELTGDLVGIVGWGIWGSELGSDLLAFGKIGDAEGGEVERSYIKRDRIRILPGRLGPSLGRGVNSGIGAFSLPTPSAFVWDPESLGQIPTGLPGYSYARTGAAHTIQLIGGKYTVVSVPENSPQYVDHPVLGSGLWSEDYAANTFTNTDDFSHSDWTKNNCTAVGGQAAPDGSNDAFYINGSGSSFHTFRQDHTIAAFSTSNLFAVFAKPGNEDYLRLYMGATAERGHAFFDLVNGGTTETGGPDFVSAGTFGPFLNDFYYCWMLCGTDSGTSIGFSINAAQYNDATYASSGNDIIVWGPQMIADAIHPYHSYILSGASAGVRNTGRLLYECANAPTLGTLLVEATGANVNNPNDPVMLARLIRAAGSSNPESNDEIGLYCNAADSVYGYMRSGGGTADEIAASGDDLDGNRFTAALSYAANDMHLYRDGVSEGVDFSITIPTSIDTVELGGGGTVNGVLHRALHIGLEDVSVWP